MAKRDDFRPSRKRRGFDDDDEDFGQRSRRDTERVRPGRTFSAEPAPFEGLAGAPSQLGAAVAGALSAQVKWFNPEKGFGFVELSDGSGDVFLHIAVLQNAGADAVSPGTTLRVEVGQGPKGRQVTRVIDVDESTAVAEAPRRAAPRAPTGRGPDPSTAVDLAGSVKWFNGTKGFGFVGADDHGKDVFVHASVLERSGILGLAEGQRVEMRVVETPKGREAVSIRTAD